MLLDRRQEFGADDRIRQRAFHQRFGEAFDDRERRAQFVADVGDEFLAQLLIADGSRGVVGDEHEARRRAFGGERAGGNLQISPDDQADLERAALAALEHFAGRPQDRLVGHQFPQGAAGGAFMGERQQLCRFLVDQHDALMGVGGDDAVAHAGEDRQQLGSWSFSESCRSVESESAIVLSE